MPIYDLLPAVVYGISAFLAAYVALSAITRLHRPAILSGKTSLADTMVFLLRGGDIVDANLSGRRFIQSYGAENGGVSALSAALHVFFDKPESLLNAAMSSGPAYALSRDETLQATTEQVGATLRLKIENRSALADPSGDIFWKTAQETELQALRKTTESAPFLVWREAPDGTPIWVNRAYLDVTKSIFGPDRIASWPLPQIFSPPDTGPASSRVSVKFLGESDPRWFDCHRVPFGKDTLCTAFDANSTVRAETQLRDFMQTLTKTFAQLTTGLAIFDKSRHLALFNPAMTELTQLPVDFLASRPSLVAFLDKLRERRMVPEPRDYRGWRKSIAELETAAAKGSYSETWSLPGGLTYRVTGRPHPDGAIAFLFEDISAEISLTRHFRRELEIGQSLLDNIEDATALFSRTGSLVQSNRAYRVLWDVDPDTTLIETTAIEASRQWHDKSLPTPVWGDFRDFVVDAGDRSEWTARTTLRDGRILDCRFIPVAGGGTQSIFRVVGQFEGLDDQMREVV